MINASSILFFFLGAIFVQVGQNPFDIPEKGKTIEQNQSKSFLDTLSNEDSIMHLPESSLISPPPITQNNPFDINKGRSSLSSKESNSKPSQSPLTQNTKTPGLLKIDTDFLVLLYSLIMLVIITMAVSMNKSRFVTIIKSIASSNQIRSLYRETRAWTNGQSLILYLIFFFNTSFVVWLANTKLNLFGETRFFLILVAILGIYAVRHIVMWLIAQVYPVETQAITHSFAIALHNQALGVAILPFILGLEYVSIIPAHTIVFILLGIFLLSYMLRQGKSALMALGSRGFNPFYFFLYLCAIEIAPYLVAYKLLIGAL